MHKQAQRHLNYTLAMEKLIKGSGPKELYDIEEKINYVCEYLQSDAAWDEKICAIFKQCFGDPNKEINVFQTEGHMINHEEESENDKLKESKPGLVRMANKEAVKQGLYKMYSATSRARIENDDLDEPVDYVCKPDEERESAGLRKLEKSELKPKLIMKPTVELGKKALKPIAGKNVDEIMKKAAKKSGDDEREVIDKLACELSRAAVGTRDYIVCPHDYRAAMLEVDQECTLKKPFTRPPRNPNVLKKIGDKPDEVAVAKGIANYNEEEIKKGKEGWPIHAIENAANWGFFVDQVANYLDDSCGEFKFKKVYSRTQKNYKVIFRLVNGDHGIYIENSGSCYANVNSEAYLTVDRNEYPSPYIFKANDIRSSPKVISLESAPSDSDGRSLYLSYRNSSGKVKLYDAPLGWEIRYGVDSLHRLFSTEHQQYMGLWGSEPYVRGSMEDEQSSRCIKLEETKVFPPLRIKHNSRYIGREDPNLAPACNQLLYVGEFSDSQIFLPIHVTDNIIFLNCPNVRTGYGKTELEVSDLWLSYRGASGATKLYDVPLAWLIEDLRNGCYALKSLYDSEYMGMWGNEPYVRGCYHPTSSDAQFTFERVNLSSSACITQKEGCFLKKEKKEERQVAEVNLITNQFTHLTFIYQICAYQVNVY
eukprot:TRINITY_DN2462_c0_g1_i1.p1 TRINITY_DN2462_c0_g1~~TRINITY_DN2462_c0_g1_i1.p1  ORF type:complete len:651 (-),score=44.52 TRINITY_DN2462_c0_g1_i1:73-2025(-)